MSCASIALAAFSPACGASSSTGSGPHQGTGGADSAPVGGGGASAGVSAIGGGGTNIIVDMGGAPAAGGDDGTGGSCATGFATATRLPVYLQFVLDGSGSMNGPGSWVAARDALKDIFTDMKGAKDTGIGAGLIVFMDLSDPNLGTNQDPVYPSSADVPVGFVDDAQLAKLVGRTAPPDAGKSNTPTGLALTGAYASLGQFQATGTLAANGKKVVVLITDGAPTDRDCKLDNKGPTADYTQNACIQMAATQLTASSGALETFVIGVGPVMVTNTYDPYFLGALAVSGGSAPAGCDPKSTALDKLCFFSIDPSASSDIKGAFTDAINKIRGDVVSCSLALQPSMGGSIDPTKVRVTLDGMTVYKDPIDGWTYDDPNNPTNVTLNGKSCAALRSDPNAMIQVTLGCAFEPPPIPK